RRADRGRARRRPGRARRRRRARAAHLAVAAQPGLRRPGRPHARGGRLGGGLGRRVRRRAGGRRPAHRAGRVARDLRDQPPARAGRGRPRGEPAPADRAREARVRRAGLAFLPQPLLFMAVSPLARRIVASRGSRLPLALGSALAAIAAVILLAVDATSPYGVLVAGLALNGVGGGLAIPAVTAGVMG